MICHLILLIQEFGIEQAFYQSSLSICLNGKHIKSKYSRHRRERKVIKEDDNEVFSIYYHFDGQHVDERVDEIVDTNDYYGVKSSKRM